MTDTRIMPCEMCGGDGELSHETSEYIGRDGNCWRGGWVEECPACLGSKVVEVGIEPLTEADAGLLDAAANLPVGRE